jgi:hypothetical protein
MLDAKYFLLSVVVILQVIFVLGTGGYFSLLVLSVNHILQRWNLGGCITLTTKVLVYPPTFGLAIARVQSLILSLVSVCFQMGIP